MSDDVKQVDQVITDPNNTVVDDNNTVATPESKDAPPVSLPDADPQEPPVGNIPYNRFKEVVDKKNELEQRLKEYEQNQYNYPIEDTVPPFPVPWQQDNVNVQAQPNQTEKVYSDEELNKMIDEAQINSFQASILREKRITYEEQQRAQAFNDQQRQQISHAFAVVSRDVPEINDPNSDVYKAVHGNPQAYTINGIFDPVAFTSFVHSQKHSQPAGQPAIDANAYNAQRQAMLNNAGGIPMGTPVTKVGNKVEINQDTASILKKMGYNPSDKDFIKAVSGGR